MNENILKGKWQEIKGWVKEKWGKLTDNDLCAIKGKGEKLLGLVQKKYGYLQDKTELEYKDSAELLAIVSSIREIMTKNKDFMPFASIARYMQPLLAKKRESQITVKDEKQRYDSDRYFDSRLRRRTTNLASQQELGILSQRRTWIGSSDFDHLGAYGADLRDERVQKTIVTTIKGGYHEIQHERQGKRNVS
jgi:uncharacterized protein YjbJ (UPF0337 family)